MLLKAKFFIPFIDNKLNRIDTVELEYKNQNLVIHDSLLDDMFKELYVGYKYQYQEILNNIPGADGHYDVDSEKFILEIPGMLSENKNLLSLKCALASKYMAIASAMLNMME